MHSFFIAFIPSTRSLPTLHNKSRDLLPLSCHDLFFPSSLNLCTLPLRDQYLPSFFTLTPLPIPHRFSPCSFVSSQFIALLSSPNPFARAHPIPEAFEHFFFLAFPPVPSYCPCFPVSSIPLRLNMPNLFQSSFLFSCLVPFTAFLALFSFPPYFNYNDSFRLRTLAFSPTHLHLHKIKFFLAYPSFCMSFFLSPLIEF